MASLALSLDYSHVLSAWEEMGGAAFADGDSAILDAKDPGAVTLDLSGWEARLKPLAAAAPPPPLDATVPAHMNIFAPFFLPPDQLALSYLQPGAVPSGSPTASAASAFPMPFGACCGMPPFPFMPPAWPPAAAAPAMPTTSSDSGAQVVPVCPSPSTAAAQATSNPSPCSSADGDASNQAAPVTPPSPSDPAHGDQHDTSRQQDCVMREEAGCGSADPADALAAAPATSSMSGPDPDQEMGASDHDFALDMGMIQMMQFGDFDVNAIAAADAAATPGDAAESANAVSTAPGSPCLSTRTSELGVVPDLPPADAHTCATSPPGAGLDDASRSHSPVAEQAQAAAAAAAAPVPSPAPATALPSATFPFLAAALAAQAVAAAGGALSRTMSTPLCGTPASFVPVAQAPALARSQSLAPSMGAAVKAEPVAVAPCGTSAAEPEGPAAAAAVPQPATRAAAAPSPAAPPTAPVTASGAGGNGGAQFYRTRAEALERYRQKKARRHYQKKIRYQLRKINADKRPRIKGRFVKKEELEEFLAARQQQQQAAGGGGLYGDLAGAAAMFEEVDDADAVLGLGLGLGLESDEE